MACERSLQLWVGGAVVALMGCSSARDVEVSGSVTAPSSISVEGSLVIDIVDVVGEGRAVERTVAARSALAGLGEFEAKVMLEGDQVLVRVTDDRDGDGQCSPGEAWGEAHAPVEGDRAEGISLMLWTMTCPVR